MKMIRCRKKEGRSWTARLNGHIARVAVVMLAMLDFSTAVKAQTDYSGTYYIASKDYNSNTPANNFYLCPTEGWAFYQATDDFTSTDNGQPFLTTHKCRDGQYDVENKAVWIVEKHPTQNYYYIKRASDGKYIVLNGQIRTTSNSDRIRVHLESLAYPDDKALFALIPNGTAYNIKPKTLETYLTINGGNDNSLQGVSGKGNGPSGFGNTKGVIGIYATLNDDALFYLEPAAIDPPVITNNFDGTFTITADAGATIYYTTDGNTPTTSTVTNGSSPVNINQTESLEMIKALAKHPSNTFPTPVITYYLPVCECPVIDVTGHTVTITCATAGAAIHYSVNGAVSTSSTTYSGSFNITDEDIVRAVATKTGYYKSNIAILAPPTTVHSSSEIDDMGRSYILASDFTSTAAIGTFSDPFRGSIDGRMVTLSGLDHPLVAYADGAIIKNVILDNVSISGGSNVGAICNEAKGNTRIYNCGVLATNSTAKTDKDGYTTLTNCSSNISGSGIVGGIVGLLDGTSRVINCFSYANITAGAMMGGIVGRNAQVTTATDIKTMVMNCMFYGEISGSGSKAPIYNGEIITNVGENIGVSNYNFFRLEAQYIQNEKITKVYNCALGAETRFLQRFEFFRLLLNSHRELAAWWATGDETKIGEIKKWVLEPTQIGSTTPYPILKDAGTYASVVNYTPSTIAYDDAHRSQGRQLTSEGDNGVLHVTISMGSGGAQFAPPAIAGLKSGQSETIDLIITDKDTTHFNFNYGKVQLPYYNDYCDGNYTGNRVVTGWKITSITGGVNQPTSYSTGADVTYTDGELTATPYNFADRKCTAKDLYSTSGRVFNQGAYWDVPEGVTAITIEPYWAKAAYLADQYLDVVYNTNMTTAYPVTAIGNTTASTFNGQTVHRSIANAVGNSGLNPSTSHTVYDYAVVLVGNYHQYNGIENSGKPYTVTSVDKDNDHEPDYSFMLRFDNRTPFHPVRYDFLNLIGLGMAQKSTGGTGSYNLGICQPRYWFEVTNTALFRVTQFEYSPANRQRKPIIVQGGVIEQWVTQQQDAGDVVEYFHVGGNVWFKEFHRGSHQDNTGKSTPHPPVSVTGGDYAKFYLTGLYQSQAKIYDDNAECYINGGRFGEVAGAGMEGIGTSDGNGNITWVIDNADIREFYGGGINYDKPVHGNIHTIISNSHVGLFCGGPKFGDMASGRTVTSTASNCTFGKYFGAGYGGSAYNRYTPKNQNNKMNIDWNSWVRTEYTRTYNSTYKGVSTQIDYQFIPMSGNADNVCRLFVEYVGFSLATTNNVTSNLSDCTIKGNFYGGGNLGKVTGNINSTLTDCTVEGNVFGAGYSATVQTVEVDSIGFRVEPYYYTDLGTYRTGVKGKTTEYRWEHGNSISMDNTNHILYTTIDLSKTNLGSVNGSVTLNIETSAANKSATIGTIGDSTTGFVYGGGDESVVNGDIHVTLSGNTTVMNNVFGGGNRGSVSGDTTVDINN